MHEATVCYLLREGGNQTLLGKRATLFLNGIWNGPGGKKKPGENILSCLKRETKEETGVTIDIESARCFAINNIWLPQGGKHVLEWRVHFFLVKSWSGEPQALDGFDEVKWFPLQNLPYKEMMPDQGIWLPCMINSGWARMIECDVYYADREQRTVQKGSFKFGDRIQP